MSEIAIIGGGIGGLCTAIALRKFGFHPQVYEQTVVLRPTGSGIWIPPNGMAALDHLGIADAVAAEGIALDGTEIKASNGEPIVTANFRAIAAECGVPFPMLSIRRADLQRLFLSRLPDDAIHLDTECVDVHPAEPRVVFDDGTTIEPSLVIGADGVRSAVRSSLFPDVPVRYAGAVTYRGIVDRHLPEHAYQVGTAIWTTEGRFGYSAMDEDCAWWFFAVPGATAEDVPEMNPSELAARCRTFPEPVVDLVANTSPESLIRTPLGDLPSLDRWHRGAVTLLGDAAHAMTPNLAQGSAQAMEDAVVLAEELDCNGSPQRALEEYEARRKPRVDTIRQQSRMQGRLGQLDNPALVWLRNAALRYTPTAILNKQTRQMLSVEF